MIAIERRIAGRLEPRRARPRPNGLAVVIFAAMLAGGGSAPAAEIHSNGFGGGDWSDPGSWLEKTVPATDDDIVISRGDAIEFDRNDEDKQSCRQIFIDPQGTFSFKSGVGRAICRVAGAIESYGAIKIDASRGVNDHFELRLVGENAEARTVKLLKGAALSLNGRRSLDHGKHNVSIAADAGDDPTKAGGSIVAGSMAVIDLQRAEVVNIQLSAAEIDNTGAKVNERLVLNGNHFVGSSHAALKGCDSPAIIDNAFEYTSKPGFKPPAIELTACPLAELRNNSIKGRYSTGILGRDQVDAALTNCSIAGCVAAINWVGTNAMFKGLSLQHCGSGLNMIGSSGVIEDAHIAHCKIAYVHTESTLQLTSLAITDVPKGGALVSFGGGSLTLLNCNVTPEQVVVSSKARREKNHGEPLVDFLFYLVAAPKGKTPADAMIEVKTANKSEIAGAAEVNVRNSPARIVNGLTPLPQTLLPLIVRAWTYDYRGQLVDAPEYEVSVIVPSKEENRAPRKLTSVRATPDEFWYRSEPDAAKSTLEVPLP